MKRSRELLTVVLGVAMVLLGAAGPVLGQGATTYYVANNGNDTWTGAQAAPSGTNGPFRTMQRARDVIRAQLTRGMTSDITVLVRGGEYFQPFPLDFAPADSGRDGFQIIYRNYPGEVPVIHHGQRLTGWQLESGNIYRVPVSWTFQTLMTRRAPPSG